MGLFRRCVWNATLYTAARAQARAASIHQLNQYSHSFLAQAAWGRGSAGVAAILMKSLDTPRENGDQEAGRRRPIAESSRGKPGRGFVHPGPEMFISQWHVLWCYSESEFVRCQELVGPRFGFHLRMCAGHLPLD